MDTPFLTDSGHVSIGFQAVCQKKAAPSSKIALRGLVYAYIAWRQFIRRAPNAIE